MSDTLIITGWGYKDYAYAAALALRCLNNQADVRGKRTSELPKYLNSEEVKGYKNIIIIGVGVSHDPKNLMQGIKKLKNNGVNVKWLSWMRPQDEIYYALQPYEAVFLDVNNKSGTILETVARYYEIENDNNLKKMYNDLMPQMAPNPKDSDIRTCHQLIEAADYFNRNKGYNKLYQKYDVIKKDIFYDAVIRHIAKQYFILTDTEKELLNLYIQSGGRELVGSSKEIEDLRKTIDNAANFDHVRVYISGESGTGKETVAQLIHYNSARGDGPFVAFNCACVVPDLLQDQLFGHVAGAFTGAQGERKGLFEQANGGTLFLDEIAELPMDAQLSLLRVLQENRITRLGGSEEIPVNVRLITATNRDLPTLVREKKFRMDLFFRLIVLQIHAPSLKEHLEDIKDIANGYWKSTQGCDLPDDIIKILQDYSYPGNVRELQNILEKMRFTIRCHPYDPESQFREELKRLMDEHKEMIAKLFEKKTEDSTTKLSVENTEDSSDNLNVVIHRHVKSVYEKYKRNRTKAAKQLGICVNSVKNYMSDDYLNKANQNNSETPCSL